MNYLNRHENKPLQTRGFSATTYLFVPSTFSNIHLTTGRIWEWASWVLPRDVIGTAGGSVFVSIMSFGLPVLSVFRKVVGEFPCYFRKL